MLKLSKTAFILRQMYRLYRDPETNICNLSDLQIHSITGFHRDSIKSAREQLTKLKEITPLAYHTFKVRAFTKLQEKGNKTGWCSSLGMLLPPFAVCNNNCQYFENKKQEVKP